MSTSPTVIHRRALPFNKLPAYACGETQSIKSFIKYSECQLHVGISNVGKPLFIFHPFSPFPNSVVYLASNTKPFARCFLEQILNKQVLHCCVFHQLSTWETPKPTRNSLQKRLLPFGRVELASRLATTLGSPALIRVNKKMCQRVVQSGAFEGVASLTARFWLKGHQRGFFVSFEQNPAPRTVGLDPHGPPTGGGGTFSRQPTGAPRGA